MTLHENLAPFAPLLGTWRGAGEGYYPTIEPFEYTDQWEFVDIGKPCLLLVERTWINGKQAHTETGYLRRVGGAVEIVMALPTGQSECGTGTWTAATGALGIATDAAVSCTPSAKDVRRLVRRYQLEGEALEYTLEMEAMGRELSGHLRSEMKRVR